MVFLLFLRSEVKIVRDLNQRNYSVALQRAAAAILLEKMLEPKCADSSKYANSYVQIYAQYTDYA